MRYTYSTSQPPPKPSEAVDAMVALLLAKAALLVQLGGTNVYAHEVPADKPASGKWAVVRERVALGGTPETVSGLMYPIIQVRVDSRTSIHTPSEARAWNASVHELIAETLIGANLPIATGEAVNIGRKDRPAGVMYDADDESRYGIATYSLTMGPDPA